MQCPSAISLVLCCIATASINTATFAEDSVDTLAPRFVVDLKPDATLLNCASPVSGDAPYFLVHADGHVQAYDLDDGHSLLTDPIASEFAPHWIGGRRDGFVLGDSYTIARYQLQSPHQRWSVGARPQEADHEFTNPIRQCIAHGPRIFALRSDGVLACLDSLTGTISWRHKLESKSVGPFHPNGDVLALAVRRSDHESLRILATDTGVLISSIDLPPGESVLDQYPGNSTSVVLLATGLLGVDTRSGKQRWRIDEQTRMQVGQVVGDADGIYVSIDGQQVVKLSRETGERRWRFAGQAIGEKAHVELSVHGDRLLMRGESFAQVLHAESGRLLARVEALPNERVHSAVIRGEALFAIIKPNAKESMWRLHREGLQRTEQSKPSDAHYYLRAFPSLKELIVVGDTIIVQDGEQAYGFQLPSAG